MRGEAAHTVSVEDIFEAYHTGPGGLTDKEAEKRLQDYGPNKIAAPKNFSLTKAMVRQFTDVLVMILIFACILSYLMGETLDASVILFILVLNAIIGFIQEYRAEKSMEALMRMVTPHARVMRNNQIIEIDAQLLVPGDIILIEEGSKMPADARLTSTTELSTDEAPLTGESTPVTKTIDAITGSGLTPGDLKNMVFMGTVAVHGRGTAIVTSTGNNTEFGKIAHMTQNIPEERSPMQKELTKVAALVAKATIGICIVVFALGILNGRAITEMLLFAVSLAVAAVPQGLPATLTIARALGMQRMSKKNAIVRRLSSVETLGSTTIICSDKTGTLTKNQMTVQKVWVNHKTINVEGTGYTPAGRFLEDGRESEDGNLRFILMLGALCNDSSFSNMQLSGDPTEGSLLVSAMKKGFNQKSLEQEYPRIHELPFDSQRKMMSTVHTYQNQKLVFTKGGPAEVLERCTKINFYGQLYALTDELKREVVASHENMAANALRVLGFAYRDVSDMNEFNAVENDMIFVGLQAMMDPPRDEVKDAVAKCKEAGIRVVIITGDYGPTAKAIALQVGIGHEGTRVITGAELNGMNDGDLIEALQEEVIFARVAPEHKMRIVTLLKEHGEIVAVTGDGVNDAPALKAANIGVAMGISGTDVSKENADVVLMDDSFATIVSAIEEGRTIFTNIQKFLRYLFSSNLGEISAVTLGMLFFPEALIITAIQILWVNLGTDVLPALALGVDPAEPGVMKKKPRNPRERMVPARTFVDWLGAGLVIGTGTVLTYWAYSGDPVKAGTMAFTVLVLYQLVNVFNCKTLNRSFFSKEIFNNPRLWAAVISSLVLQVLVVQVGALQPIFGTQALSLSDWVIAGLISLTILLYDEVKHLIKAMLRGAKAYKTPRASLA
ncbi:MAG: cation-translocating P-type ATPase [Candidatus Woesearchaeota archaeon]